MRQLLVGPGVGAQEDAAVQPLVDGAASARGANPSSSSVQCRRSTVLLVPGEASSRPESLWRA